MKRPPSAGIIDSQSSKSTKCSDERGHDGDKKINGRKRHLLVDTMVFFLRAMVLAVGVALLAMGRHAGLDFLFDRLGQAALRASAQCRLE